MDEEKQIAEAAKALGIGELVPEVYRDLLQPAARELGDGLTIVARAVKAGLAPFEVGVWGYEQIKTWLSVRVTRILADRGVKDTRMPPLAVTGPLIFQMVFARDEPDLREMYASLVASAMDPKMEAHPSFVTVIQQLCPDEARILRGIVHSKKEFWNITSSDEEDYRRHRVKPTIEEQFSAFCRECGVAQLNHTGVYQANLVRLGVLRHVTTSEAEYYPEGAHDHGSYEAGVSNITIEFIELTPYGRLFLDACIDGPTAQGNAVTSPDD